MEVDALMFRVGLGIDRQHPWAKDGKSLVIDKDNMQKVIQKVEKHLKQLKEIEESVNGGEFSEKCEDYNKLFGTTADIGTLLLETHLLWFDLVHAKGLMREQAHQLDMADEKWRELLAELGGSEAEEGINMEVEASERDGKPTIGRSNSLQIIQGASFQEVRDGDFPELEERIVNIKNVMLAVKKGEDTRKLMRRMSRRQSNMAALS
mmetsp:Transcript_16677/g.33987  ORF Transcript_16677/g.33987 Transcript_16677/m.33987 type:complete len:207 (+) Transcript_16677:2-622(+)